MVDISSNLLFSFAFATVPLAQTNAGALRAGWWFLVLGVSSRARLIVTVCLRKTKLTKRLWLIKFTKRTIVDSHRLSLSSSVKLCTQLSP